MRLQTIQTPDPSFRQTEELYVHRQEGRLDFDGYFNLFYITKHRKYTTCKSLSLDLTVRGRTVLILMHDREEIRRVEIPAAPDEEVRGTYPFPYADHEEGVFWFALEAESEASPFVRGSFVGEAENAREVSLAVAITTFRREPYVLRNLKMMERLPADVWEQLHVLLIDNGKTLRDHAEIMPLIESMNRQGRERVRLIENANTGGCGGFTRGMREAIDLRDPLKLTNLLLMDDDAVFPADLFVRLTSLLAMLKPECREMTVGGALWREEEPWIQNMCGEWYERFKVINPHPYVDLRKWENCTADWMQDEEQTGRSYCGWWCCCYPMSVIREDTLPLPLFIHHDDIQFGMRHARNGILFLGGIGAWHRGFEFAFHSVKRYYDMRNAMITMALYQRDLGASGVIRHGVRQLIGHLLLYSYAEVELIYRGINDFLRGPEWLSGTDPEEKNSELLTYWKTHTAIRPLKEIMTPQEYDAFAAAYLTKEHREEMLAVFRSRARHDASIIRVLTFNGWFLPSRKGPAFLSMAETPWMAYRRKTVLLYDPDTKTGMWLKRSWREFFKTFGRVILVTLRLGSGYRKTADAYRRAVGL
ncbi:MAG: glycosyltransferase [Lachnospiraceae bacterium]|nr:glycosyltransferase [Lachnospiraceae bacterium]